MAISTIRGNDSPFSTVLIYFLGVLGIALTVFFGGELIRNLTGLGGKSGLMVDVTSGEAQVLINDQIAGKTPFESKTIKSGNNTIIIRNETQQYQTNIKFLPSKKDVLYTVGIIRDLGVSDTFSSGQELWFDKDGATDTIRIVSEPSGAAIYIDGSEIGETPFSSSAITAGDYELKISYPGYESQTARINVQKDYTLNGSIKLFPYPATPVVEVFEGSPNLYNISLDNEVVTSNTEAWVKGLIYWNITRGINIDDVGLNKEKLFDYFVDYKGGIFDLDGNPVLTQQDFEKLKDLKRGAYLGRISDGEGLTQQAKEALDTLATFGVASKTATIKTTSLGWLRVRESPSLNGTEVTRVNSGNSYTVLAQEGDWVKIKVSDTVEGWVYSTYVDLSE